MTLNIKEWYLLEKKRPLILNSLNQQVVWAQTNRQCGVRYLGKSKD